MVMIDLGLQTRARETRYPKEATESATVQSPLVCIALLSKINNDLVYSLLCSLQFHSCSRRNAQHSTSIPYLPTY